MGCDSVFDLMGGQKTGGFLDQRENRLAARQYARGRALDCFSYAGGFALNLARQCDSVLGIDSSPEALSLARRNQQLNGITNVEWKEANCFDFLKAADQEKQHYDTIVLDPPAFARQKSNLDAALARLQGTEPARAQDTEPGRIPPHLLMLASCERGGLAGSHRQRRARCSPHGERGRAAHAVARPPDTADRARNTLLEVFDFAGALIPSMIPGVAVVLS